MKQCFLDSHAPSQVVQETGQEEGIEVTFTGMLFQPVPWSMQTKKGMPAEFEKYSADPDYIIINTPPNFMFQVECVIPPAAYVPCLSDMGGTSRCLTLLYVSHALLTISHAHMSTL